MFLSIRSPRTFIAPKTYVKKKKGKAETMKSKFSNKHSYVESYVKYKLAWPESLVNFYFLPVKQNETIEILDCCYF